MIFNELENDPEIQEKCEIYTMDLLIHGPVTVSRSSHHKRFKDVPKYFRWDVSQSMPALVVALRPLPLAYSHVMEYFARYNKRVEIKESLLADMAKAELRVVESICFTAELGR